MAEKLIFSDRIFYRVIQRSKNFVWKPCTFFATATLSDDKTACNLTNEKTRCGIIELHVFSLLLLWVDFEETRWCRGCNFLPFTSNLPSSKMGICHAWQHFHYLMLAWKKILLLDIVFQFRWNFFLLLRDHYARLSIRLTTKRDFGAATEDLRNKFFSCWTRKYARLPWRKIMVGG